MEAFWSFKERPGSELAGGNPGHLNREQWIPSKGFPVRPELVTSSDFFLFIFLLNRVHEGARVNESYLAAREPIPYPFAPVILTGRQCPVLDRSTWK